MENKNIKTEQTYGKPLTLIMKVKSEVDRQELIKILNDPHFLENTGSDMLKVGTVHTARFVFVSKYELAVITTYDNSFNTYIEEFVKIMGDTFNLLLQHIEDTDNILPVQKNVSGFQKWVGVRDRSFQPETDTIDTQFIAYPRFSAYDIRRSLGLLK